MKINWISIEGFKNYLEKHEFNFENFNIVKGENALGKSSIGDAIAWVLSGCNYYGLEKATTRIVNRLANVTEVEIAFEHNGIMHNIKRVRVGKITDIYLDGNKTTNAEIYNKFLIGKDIFFSIFNPFYFISLSPSEAKSFLLSILPKISDKNVFELLGEYSSNILINSGFKGSSKFIEERRKEIIEINEDIIYCHGIIDGQNTEFFNSEVEMLDETKVIELENELSKVFSEISLDNPGNSINNISDDLKAINTILKKTISFSRTDILRVSKLLEELYDNLQKYKASRAEYISGRLENVKTLIREIIKLKVQVAASEVSKQNRIHIVKQREMVQVKINEAKSKIEENAERVKEINMLIDLAKQFYAKKLELESKSINKYLNNVSIQFQKVVKSTGEIKDDFKILYKKRELSTLSHSEKIKAGLEICNFVMQIIGVSFPIFIDDAESITKYHKPLTQIIEARVKEGSNLIVETYK